MPINNVERFWRKVVQEGACLVWMAAVDKDGYGKFQINLGGSANQKHMRAHRYAWFLKHGFEPSGLLLHSCDNRRCVNFEHLRSGTQKENIKDAQSRNRRAIHERHPNAKLDWDRVTKLRADYASGMSRKDLAEKYGITTSGVDGVTSQRSWKSK